MSLGADARSGTDATRADRAAQTLDALPAGVVVVSALGVVEACNPAARTLVGEDARGHLWRDVAARVFRPRPDDGPDLSLVDGRRVHIDTCSLRDPPGQVLLIQDVTELASALLYAGALARPAAEVPRVAGKLLGVLRQLEGLVRDMLLFARQGRFEMEDLTVGALIQGLREQLGPRLEARGVSLECRVDAPAAGLRGSPQALTGALGNLVDNACDAGARRVLLTAGPVGADRLAMDVADDGPGVPPELRERLFRPFFTTRPGGSGLGLAVARAVAEAHGGSVGLLDDSGGARFRIELPLWPQARYDGRTAAVQEGA